jgi:hypothetical protein
LVYLVDWPSVLPVSSEDIAPFSKFQLPWSRHNVSIVTTASGSIHMLPAVDRYLEERVNFEFR